MRMDATRQLLEFIFSVIAFTVASPDAVLFDGADPGELLRAPFVGKRRSVFLDARNVGVHEINETEVAPEERLTDSIYPMRLADGENRLSGIRPR